MGIRAGALRGPTKTGDAAGPHEPQRLDLGLREVSQVAGGASLTHFRSF